MKYNNLFFFFWVKITRFNDIVLGMCVFVSIRERFAFESIMDASRYLLKGAKQMLVLSFTRKDDKRI
jgi:L-amino acid N-acyltransferase YncA